MSSFLINWKKGTIMQSSDRKTVFVAQQVGEKSLSAEISTLIGGKIIRNELKEGERILEAKVSKDLGVSQSSLREALRILEREGLVETLPRHGTYVTKITPDEVDALYDLLAEIYVIAARRLYEKQDGAAIAGLEKTLIPVEKSGGVEDLYDAMFSLIMKALELAGSAILIKTALDLLPTKRRIEYRSLSAREKDLSSPLTHLKNIRAFLLKNDIKGISSEIRLFLGEEKKFALSIFSESSDRKR